MRSFLGNAKLDGLTADLNIGEGTQFNVALTVFYVLYVLLDIPSNWLLKIVGRWQIPAHASMCLGHRRYLHRCSQIIWRFNRVSSASGRMRGRNVRRDHPVPEHVLQAA